ncbi:MAG: radical SAM protein [Desulfobacula sp.]|nr:radical SAM protein [Desulfobacula sp.]
MDKYRIDSHKLMFHPKRVADWLENNLIYPIYMEISPAGACNHRCVFCSVDFMGYKKNFLDAQILNKRITELSKLGLNSIMFAGEGEPFLHMQLADIILHTHNSGIDVAVTTNGVLMTPEISRKILGATEWIKISCNAGTPESYARIHRTKPGDFEKVIDNMTRAVEIKKENKYSCTLGLQIILLDQNSDEIETLAKTAKNIGVDYMVVKPYTFHPDNEHRYKINYQDYAYLDERLQQLNTKTFSVVFRRKTMESWDRGEREYKRCYALPFWSYIDSKGNVWGCSSHLKKDTFNYGNIMKNSFKKIWEGPKRIEMLKEFENGFNVNKCKYNCRMDKINQYLWELKNLPEHINFI